MRTEIFVVSLPGATARRERMRSLLQDQPLPWRFLDARVGAGSLPFDERSSRIGCGRVLTIAERGCFASHYQAWTTVIKEGLDQVIILEDDVFVDWNGLAPFWSDDMASLGIDYLRLSSKRQPVTREIGWLHGRRLTQYLGYCYGTQGYVLTRTGAERFRSAVKVVDRPIDDFMDRSWVHGIETLGVYPPLVMELAVPSTIGDQTRYATNPFSWPDLAARMSERAWDKARRLAHVGRELSPLSRVRRSDLPVRGFR
jgi:glycosyl transferase family 25